MTRSSAEVCAKLRFVAFHRWPDAPEEIAYLRSAHRHDLVIRAWAPAQHDNRHIEFHALSRRLRATVLSRIACNEHGELELGPRSCEQVGRLLLESHAQLSRVEVWEDDEMGAVVYQRRL